MTITGERLLDHRLEYLEYEGPLSDDRGRCVSRTASGDYETLIAGETLSEDAAALSVLMRGKTVGGSELFWKAEFKLTDASNQSWRLSFFGGLTFSRGDLLRRFRFFFGLGRIDSSSNRQPALGQMHRFDDQIAAFIKNVDRNFHDGDWIVLQLLPIDADS